jgi:Regulator of ribonuclease activity B
MSPPIPLTQLQQMFHGMQTEAGWDTNRDLVWGYFFTHSTSAPLGRLADRLVGLGYNFVDIYPTDDGEVTFLRVEKIETHTPQSLDLRNRELEDLAHSFGVEYDGMDAGPVPP